MRLASRLRPANPERRRIALALPLLGGALWAAHGLPARAAPGAPQGVERGTWALMGTRVDIVAQGAEAALMRHAMAQAAAEMRRLEALMSRFQPTSVVSRINAAAGIAPVAVPAEVMEVLVAARQVSLRTQGRFDPTVGAYKTWSFAPGQSAMPDPAELARQRRLVDARGIVLDAQAGTAFLNRRGMALDLGAIAKLPILEAGMRVLRAQGIDNALVNGGGDVLTAGLWHGHPWRVGLRDPRAPERLLGAVSVSGTAVVASSGDYERFFMHQGVRQHHILDPRTGLPTIGVHGVSLVARSVDEVNGMGTALMVQGMAAGRQWAARAPQLAVLMAGADGSVWQSSALRALLEPVPA